MALPSINASKNLFKPISTNLNILIIENSRLGGTAKFMLKGRQFFLLRTCKNITREEVSDILGISYNDIIMYENGIKEIPEELYNRWIDAIKAIGFNKHIL